MRWPYKIGVRLSNINASLSIESLCSLPHTLWYVGMSNLEEDLCIYLAEVLYGQSTCRLNWRDVRGKSASAQSVFQVQLKYVVASAEIRNEEEKSRHRGILTY